MIGPLITLIKNEIRRIWCYRWLVAATTLVLCSAAAVYIRQLPSVYDAWGQIYVAPQTPLVAAAEGVSLVGNGYGSAYVVLTTLLNDDNLEKIVRRIDPAAASMNKAEMALAVNSLREQIHRAPDPGEGFIELHVTDTDPVRARDIVQLLMEQFISTNIGRSQRDLGRAGEFLSEQVASYGSMIEGSQANIAAFRASHPEVARLAAPGIGQMPSYGAPQVAGDTQVFADGPREAPARPTPSPAALRVTELEAKLATLLTTYTERYPDVVATRRQLADAMAVRDSEHAAGGSSRQASAPTGGPMRAAPRRTAPRMIAAPAPVAPDVVAAWTDLQKADELLRANYQQLLAKQAATRMSQAVYQGDEAGKYQIVRQPVVPVIPVGPNRLLYAALAVVVSATAGLGLGYLRAAMVGILVSRQELETTFQLPVIATVSWEPAWHTPRPEHGWLGRVASRLQSGRRTRLWR